MSDFKAALGRYENPVKAALRFLDETRFLDKLRGRDASIWTSDPDLQKKIKDRLGWLSIPSEMRHHAGALTEFARSIREAGFTHVVLLGMGGSSLCAEVCRETYGVASGHPDLVVLDSTDPDTILRIEKSVNLERTLFILASKSGTTIEMQSLYRYFSSRLAALKRGSLGERFIAITDPETPLEALARAQGFRKIFLSPPDIGGRYSALSYFGLVPLALIGMDMPRFLDRAHAMAQACLTDSQDSASIAPVDRHPALFLGAVLGALGREGLDKVTLTFSPGLRSFGGWLEQLLAESTGKEGKGLVPVDGEALGRPDVYGEDRLFIRITLPSNAADAADPADQTIRALEESGHPVVRIRLSEPLDLAGEFFRWELATATAGAILSINPFDEPNVTESKENTLRLLGEFQATGRFSTNPMRLEQKGVRLYSDQMTDLKGSLREALDLFLKQAKPSDYVAVTAYLDRSDPNDGLLQRFRVRIRDRYRLAVTLGYGPRYLHSTGQLHKGGPRTGCFIQITSENRADLSIPGQPYGFSTLKRAQALGDYLSINRCGLPILRMDLGRDEQSGLETLTELI
ncbi:MAG: glucose-6-phosphate isomerase [Nitrospirae bacterium]|nr:glucose-6-phosphate isomerase [Nitrospirota bacterium]